MNIISKFKKEYSWLSNFHPITIPWAGRNYPSVENYYQAMKLSCSMESTKDLGMIWHELTYCKPGQAKRLSRTINIDLSMWNAQREETMLNGLKVKFATATQLQHQLIATGDKELVEGNYWHDNFWGDCKCNKCVTPGLNVLGQLLMRIRTKAQIPIRSTNET